jgi:hypothetical protein
MVNRETRKKEKTDLGSTWAHRPLSVFVPSRGGAPEVLDEGVNKDDLGREKADSERWSFRYRYRPFPRLVVRLNRVKKYVARSCEMTLSLVFLALDRL